MALLAYPLTAEPPFLAGQALVPTLSTSQGSDSIHEAGEAAPASGPKCARPLTPLLSPPPFLERNSAPGGPGYEGGRA